MKEARQIGQVLEELEEQLEEHVGTGVLPPVFIPGFIKQQAAEPCLDILANLPTGLHPLILAHAAAPLDTCKASAAILQDPGHLAAWMTAAAAEGKLQKPVQVAAELGQWKVCSILLQNVEGHVYPNFDLSLALYDATEAGQVQLVQQLLEKGAWASEPWSYPHHRYGGEGGAAGLVHFAWTPTPVRTEGQWAPCFSCLIPYRPWFTLSCCAVNDWTYSQDDWNRFVQLLEMEHILVAAARLGNADICSLLLKHNIYPKAVLKALTPASTLGHLAVVQLLLEEVNRREPAPQKLRPALCAAAKGAHLGLVRCLVEHGAHVTLPSDPAPPSDSGVSDSEDDEYGSSEDEEGGTDPTETSCMVAAAAGGSIEVLELLSTSGASLGQHWGAAIEAATHRRHLIAVQWLQTRAPPVPAAGPQQLPGGQHSAGAAQGAAEGYRYWKRYGFITWWTNPLVRDAMDRKVDLLQMLLQTGRWSKSQVNDALLATSCTDHRDVDIMQLLRQHGADVNIVEPPPPAGARN
jgi:hypothetical protein